ncbi:RecE family exodeoxyribonuclease [Citrobacter sp. S-77]|uniref:RecE family exodeoxyribonuclease n=1 Tax=Citrobacter sp. S-77 TaxID=1080067 RepID=UPI0005EDB40E|nr:RecE family exodeoxyribonuclease [Citrobacter sp. S-77]
MSKQQEYPLLYPVKNEGARKRLGFNNGFYWKTEDSLARAILRANVALIDAGFSLEDFKKPIRVNFPVENDIPPEGVFDTRFCNNRELGGEDGKTLMLISDKNADVSPDDKKDAATDNTSTNEADKNKPDTPQLTSVPTMPLQHRILAQYVGNGEYLYHVDAEQKAEILRLEMDTENTYVQNMMTAAKNVDAFKNAAEIDIHRVVKAYKTVFPLDKKVPEITVAKRFLEDFFATEHIDRGLLVKEWQEKAVQINQSKSGTELRHQHKQTWKTLDLKVAVAFWPGDVKPGSVDGSVLRWAKTEIIGKDREDWKRFSATLRTVDNILEYDDQTIFLLVQMRPLDIHKDPVALKNYITEFLATHAQPEVASEQLQTGSVNEEGKSDDEEKPQSTGTVADEPATPETVEPDTTEHHQDAQTLDAQPQINSVDAKYQKLRAELHEARENIPPKNSVDVDKLLAAARGEYVEGISDPNDPKWIHEDYRGITTSNEGEKSEVQTENDQETPEETAGDNFQEDNENAQSDAGCDAAGDASDTVNTHWPSWFEPGRYEAIPNEVYHSANGISSTMLKDARISLMYYHGRHMAGTIPREESDALLRGRIIHSYVLETDKFADEYAVPSPVPDSVVTTSQDLVAIIKEYNAALPALMTPDELKAWIEEYNATLPAQIPMTGDKDAIGLAYMTLPAEFKRVIGDNKNFTATAMKSCIKEYNATLPPLLKTSGTREQLLDQIATVDPTLAENERAKFLPYNVSGTKEQLTEIVRKIRPDIVTIEDWQKQQEVANRGKTFITVEMYEQAKNIHAALQNNQDAARLLNHPERKSEISYFGFDEETGLEIRVRPDIEIRLPYESICADLKSVSLGYVRQERLKDRLHREIIERDYHLSAAMYCDVANLEKFFWIFVNKDAGYHWVAVVEASPELLELGRQEYRRTLRQINQALETNHWPAPITESYTDELNDFDLRRLEALSI